MKPVNYQLLACTVILFVLSAMLFVIVDEGRAITAEVPATVVVFIPGHEETAKIGEFTATTTKPAYLSVRFEDGHVRSVEDAATAFIARELPPLSLHEGRPLVVTARIGRISKRIVWVTSVRAAEWEVKP
jgi:hypothetical protein